MFGAPVHIIRTTPSTLAALMYDIYRLPDFSLCNISNCLVTSYPLWYRYFPELLQFMYFTELHYIYVNFVVILFSKVEV